MPPVLSNGKSNPKYSQYYRAHFWDQYDFTDERLWYSRILPQKLQIWVSLNAQPIDSTKAALDQVLKKSAIYPKTRQLVLRLLMQQFENLQMINGDALLVHLFDRYFPNASSAGVDTATWLRLQYKAELFRPNLIGQTAPDFTLPDLNDSLVSLQSFKAKYTLLYFYSPLCTRCRELTPDVHGLTKNYLAKGLRVLAVTTDCPDKNYWKTYTRQNLGDWTCVLESGGQPSALERLYATAQLPNVYFLDENKKIVLKRVPVERLQDFLDAWVK